MGGGGKGKWGAGSWGGNEWGLGQQKGSPDMEAELSAMANRVYEAVLNLNVPPQQVASMWDSTTNLRNRVLASYGIHVPQGGGKGGKKGGKGGNQAPKAALGQSPGGGNDGDFKGKLLQLVMKTGAKVDKNTLSFEHQELVGEDGKKSYTCGLACEHLQKAYTGGPSKSKKDAEQDACKTALDAEFPGESAALSTPHTQAQGGIKRKMGDDNDRKGKLAHGVRLLLARPSLPSDIVYTTTKQEDVAGEERYVSVLSLPTLQVETYTGEVCETSKEAEHNAAGVGLAALSSSIEAAAAENEVRKKAKLQAKKERQRESKEAAQAEAGLGLS